MELRQMLDFPHHISNEEYYPTGDGQPMAETDTHREQMITLIKSLEYFYEDHPDVYVSGNLLMFYEEGSGKKHRSPDVLIALGVEKRERDHYKIWEEGKAPDVVFEITSRSTQSEDLGEKKGLYAYLGVKEYVVFDPLNEYLDPPLRLYRLAGDEFLRVAGSPLRLESVGLDLEVKQGRLRLSDPQSGGLLLTPEERAEVEAARADEAERRLKELEEKLRRLEGSD